MTLSFEARADLVTIRSIWPSVRVGTWESSRRRVLFIRIHELHTQLENGLIWRRGYASNDIHVAVVVVVVVVVVELVSD